jgi:hypothetical protein
MELSKLMVRMARRKAIMRIAAPELLETVLGKYKGSFHLHGIQEAVDTLKM